MCSSWTSARTLTLPVISVEHAGPVNGSIFWDLSEDPSWVLIEHSITPECAASTPRGVGALWDTISFFVRGPNDPPEVPELIAPSSVQLIEVARPASIPPLGAGP